MSTGLRIGFTGTQRGMTQYQKKQLIELLNYRNPSLCIHGDCIGADAEFHNIAKGLGIFVEIHPPVDPKKRAFCDGDVIREPFPYLERNHNIVDTSDYMIATPKEDSEELRSGTWATIRYARKKNKQIIILRPNKNGST